MVKNSRGAILRDHYVSLLRKATSWLGTASIIATVFVALPATAAGQITTRSTTLGNSKAAANTTYTFTFKPATTGTVKALKFEVCTSPLSTTTCVVSNSSTMAGGALVAGNTTAPFNASWTAATGSAAPSTTAFWLHFATGSAVTSGVSYTVQLSGIVNPNVANTQFYTRITTYSDDAAGAPAVTVVDYGGMAVSTGTEMTVAANVQESLNFTVGQTGTCGSISGSTVNIGSNPGTDNVLQLGVATAGTSVMCVGTNATGGYALSYISNQASSNGFTNGTYTLTDSSGGSTFASAVSGGSDLFGINLRANTGASSGPTAGADPSTTPTSYGAGYGTLNTYAFSRGAVTNIANYTTGPTTNNLYTVTYAAVAGNTTATGAYQVKMNYIATGTF